MKAIHEFNVIKLLDIERRSFQIYSKPFENTVSTIRYKNSSIQELTRFKLSCLSIHLSNIFLMQFPTYKGY